MIVLWLLLIPFICGLLAWLIHPWSRQISLIGLAADAGLLLAVWVRLSTGILQPNNPWILEFQMPWNPSLGIGFHLAMDGLSLLLTGLTLIIGIVSVASSWTETHPNKGSFYFALMSVLTGILGVFTAADLFLFYFFWELMLIPMFFLINMWGSGNKGYAALKFFLYTQAGGLIMLISIIALYWIHGKAAGTYTYNYPQIMENVTAVPFLVVLGFFIGFTVKIPIVPIHVWQPDAYADAPIAGTIILAGVMSKTGAYGLIRFVLPLVSGETEGLVLTAMTLGVVGIIYGAMTAFAQTDLKRLIAYTSISHLGFVLLGIFAGSRTALLGAVVVMLAHGLSTGGLFVLAGSLQQRIRTRDISRMGGLWSVWPRMGGVALFFVLASLGLPGLANFIGEFMVLAGTFQNYPWFSAIGSIGFVVSTIYSIWIMNRVFHGQPHEKTPRSEDLRFGEMLNVLILMAGLLWIGLFPQIVLNTARPAVERVITVRPENAGIEKSIESHAEQIGIDNKFVLGEHGKKE